MGWRYIIIRTETHDIPIIYPDCLVHAEVAQAICGIEDMAKRGAQPLSAGELTVYAGNCCGESETLGLQSRGVEDDACIASHEYGVRGMRDLY